MRLQDFNYRLPKELIAQHPPEKRDSSRLMVLDRTSRDIEHTSFHEITRFLKKGDLLVANDTRVVPARLYGKKDTGGWVELFLLNPLENGAEGSQVWECLLKSRRNINACSTIFFTDELTAEVLGTTGSGTWNVRLVYEGEFETIIDKLGNTPLPQYIKRDRSSEHEGSDRERYQTVYAKNSGAVAAPTAGFHFTGPLISTIREKGADIVFVTLHVGYGTFQSIRGEVVEQHRMHREYFNIDKETAAAVNKARSENRRVIAVGTTTTRVLETVARHNGSAQSGRGYTDLFIYPGYDYKSVDALITNFHLPKSSLLMLVCAFAGKAFILDAYRQAIERKYRFFSYGDAMLIL